MKLGKAILLIYEVTEIVLDIIFHNNIFLYLPFIGKDSRILFLSFIFSSYCFKLSLSYEGNR